MSAMIDFLDVLGVAAVPVLWLPLAAWTIVLGALVLLLRAFEMAHPLLRYRFAQGGLIVLPLGVLLVGTMGLLPAEEAPVMVAVAAALPAITVGAAPMPLDVSTIEQQAISLWTAAGAATVLAILAALVGTGRLLADWLALRGLRRGLPATDVTTVRAEMDVLRSRLKVRRDVGLHIAPGDVVPMTAGIIHPVIILPASLQAAERRLALAHELVHVRQVDVLGQWLERIVAALFAIHPGVHWLQRRCALLREMSCDAALVAEAQADRRSYSDLLFSYADVRGRLLAPGMADRRSHVHQRIKAMATFSLTRIAPSRAATSLLVASVLLAGSLALAAPRLVDERQVAGIMVQPDRATASDTIFVVVEQMPAPVGGLEGIQERVRYPELARHAGIEGTVYVQFVVNSDGAVSELLCVRHPGAGTCEAAIAAIRETEFRPGRQGGVALPVRFSLPIRFRLAQDDPQEGLGIEPLGMRVEHLGTRFTQTDVEIRGRVFADGAPVAGASIVVGRTRFGAATDEAGVFQIRMPFDRIAEAVELVATHHQYGVTRTALDLPGRFPLPVAGRQGDELDTGHLETWLEPVAVEESAWVIRGRVIEAPGGQPVSAATVVVNGVQPVIGAATDGNGHFVIRAGRPILDGRRVSLLVSHPQHQSVRAPVNLGYALPGSALPDAFAVRGAYPQPSGIEVIIAFELPEDAEVRLQLFDITGRHVTEQRASVSAGSSRILTIDTSPLAAGVYVYQLQAQMSSGVQTESGQLTVIR